MIVAIIIKVIIKTPVPPSPLQIAARPGAQHLRCLYRVTFVPRDAYDLLRKDSMAFEYLYLQVNTPTGGLTPVASPQAPSPSHRSPLFPPLCSPLCNLSRLYSNCPSGVPEPHWGFAISQSPAQSLQGASGNSTASLGLSLSDVCRPFVGLCLVSLPSPPACFGPSSPWSMAVLRAVCPSQVLSTGVSHRQVAQTSAGPLPLPHYAGPIQHLYPSAAREISLFKKPTWRGVAKGLWNYRKLVQLLYHLRFLLYLLAKLKSLGKWALGAKVMAVLLKNLELVKKHLRKLGAVGAAVMRWRAVRRLLRQVRKLLRRYFGLSALWRLLKRLARKKK